VNRPALDGKLTPLQWTPSDNTDANSKYVGDTRISGVMSYTVGVMTALPRQAHSEPFQMIPHFPRVVITRKPI